MSEAKRSTFMKRVLIAILAVALVFTMMPLSMGKVFAAGETPTWDPDAVALTVDGTEYKRADVVAMTSSTYTYEYTSKKTDPNTGEKVDVNNTDVVVGVALSDLLNGKPADYVAKVQTADDYSPVNADGKTVADLSNADAHYILAYQINGKDVLETSKDDATITGCFVLYGIQEGKVKRDKMVNRITVSEPSTEPGEDPVPVLTVVGDDLVKTLSFNTIDELKGDKVKEVPVVRDKTFHTKNASGSEKDRIVTGVTMESLINLAGIKEGMELDSLVINAKSSDGDATRTLTADQVLKQDLLGNKAMVVWKEDGKQVYKTAVGQFTEGEENNTYWLKADTLELKVVAKEKVAPVKPEPTKVANTLTVTPKNKTFKAKALKKKAKSYKALTVKNAKGAVTYTVKYKNKKAKKALKFNKKTGMIKVTKKTKKGTYKVTVTVKAAGKTIGDKIYLPKTVKKTITVKVK